MLRVNRYVSRGTVRYISSLLKNRQLFLPAPKPKLYLPALEYPTIQSIARSEKQLFLPYYKTSPTDAKVSGAIFSFTNSLRRFSFNSVNWINKGTNFTVGKLIKAKEFNQRVLPAELFPWPISPLVHTSVIKLKNGAIFLNKAFDKVLHVVIWIGKEFGKLLGKGAVVAFKTGRYLATNKYGAKDFMPRTQDSVEYFFKASVDEGFVILEAFDDSLTRTFGASTDMVLQTIEHCFGENVKDISAELSVMSKETFEFYKKVKLFKLRNIKVQAAQEGTKEVFNVIVKELKK